MKSVEIQLKERGGLLVEKEMDSRREAVIKSLQNLGSTVMFMCDSSTLKVICDRIELTYDEENGLRLLSNGVDVSTGAESVMVEFKKNDFPRLFVKFEPNPIRITREMLEKKNDNLGD